MKVNRPTPHIQILPTVEEFAMAAAQVIVAAIVAAIRERGHCLLALSGGGTPGVVFRRLSALLVSQAVALEEVYIIFVDERIVPPDNPDSNYGMVRAELISRVAIPPGHIYRIKGEEKPEAAAHDYERELTTVLPLFGGRCDLILLGVGENGHIASLFPGSQILREFYHPARAVFIPHLKSWRVTLTLPVINRARAVLFLATGKEKAAIVGRVLKSSKADEDLPATLVWPDSGTVSWMVDAAAAAEFCM